MLIEKDIVMKTYTITYDQIRNLHNGKCDLYFLQQWINENFKEDSPAACRINDAMKRMAPVIESLMAERDREIEEIEAQADLIRKGREFRSIWSIDRTEFKPEWKGMTLTYLGINTIIPTDRDVNMETLYPLCDSLIRESGDDHHVFIEGFYEEDGKVVMFTGS